MFFDALEEGIFGHLMIWMLESKRSDMKQNHMNNGNVAFEKNPGTIFDAFYKRLGLNAISFLGSVSLFAMLAIQCFGQSSQPRTPVISIAVGPGGFRPSAVSVKGSGGYVYLCVFNRAVRSTLEFRLDQQPTTAGGASTRLQDVNVPLAVQDWRPWLYLNAGTYLLTEANHPTWTCTITIQ